MRGTGIDFRGNSRPDSHECESPTISGTGGLSVATYAYGSQNALPTRQATKLGLASPGFTVDESARAMCSKFPALGVTVSREWR